jgi:hypothetical protein
MCCVGACCVALLCAPVLPYFTVAASWASASVMWTKPLGVTCWTLTRSVQHRCGHTCTLSFYYVLTWKMLGVHTYKASV